jgi:hypothetical protein
MKNTDPYTPTRRGMSPRARIELWHVALAAAVVLALVGIGLALWIDLTS